MTHHATIDVIRKEGQGVKTLRTLRVSEAEWKSVNYVDYIEVDQRGVIASEMVAGHGREVALRMAELLKQA